MSTTENKGASADLWMHNDMDRDAAESAIKAPRKDLQAAHRRAVDDLIEWRRRALEAESRLAAQPVAAQVEAAPQAEQVAKADDFGSMLDTFAKRPGALNKQVILNAIRMAIEDAATHERAAAPADKLIHEIKKFLGDMHAMPVDWTIKESQVLYSKVSDYLATARAAEGNARDAARLEKFISWFLRAAPRSEIHEHGHIERTTREHVITWLDATQQASAQKGGA